MKKSCQPGEDAAAEMWKRSDLQSNRMNPGSLFRDLGPVRLYIWKVHPDGSVRWISQMLYLGVVRLYIWKVHLDEASRCSCVRLFIFLIYICIQMQLMTK